MLTQKSLPPNCPGLVAASLRQLLLRFAQACLALAFCIASLSPPSIAAEKPTNIVLILIDNQGYFELGCKGNPYLSTPNIDRFARDGVDFCNFHAENFCSPSRAALLTGRQPMRYGVHNTVGGVSLLAPTEITLADRLREAGYRTGVFGKWHLGMTPPFHPMLRGFDEVFVHGGGGIGQLEDYTGNNHIDAHFQRNGKWEKSSGYSSDVLFAEAMRFIEESTDEPFFCYLPTPAVHFPVQAEPRALARIKSRGVRDEQINLSLASMIENLDENLGRMLAHLEKLQLRDNTLVIFMSDQGVGDRGSQVPVWPGKERQADLGNASEGKHRVFCMMQKPGLTIAKPNQALCCIRDIFPTVLETCNVDQPNRLDGRSLVPLLKGKEDWSDKRTIVMQCPRGREREKWKHAVVKHGPWRLVSGNRLYHIEKDTLMEQDVASQHPDVVAKLEEAYEEFWRSLPPAVSLTQRHSLGTNSDTPTVLCAMDWHEGGSPWNSGALRDSFRSQGSWPVRVTQDGRYRLTLRRTLQKTDLPLNAAHCKITVGPFSATTEVKPGATECDIEMHLETGDYDLQTELRSQLDPSDTWGANFVDVKLVAPVTDEKPKVLIIGDSISLGYTPVLQGMLMSEVDIIRPPNGNGGWINCEGTKRGVEMIDEWLSLGEFDVIHFNFGLHDLKHVHPETGRNSTNPEHPQQSNLAEYRRNLKLIVERLKSTDAKLVFATTTPYPDRPGGPLRRADQPAKYNQVALEIMKNNDVQINDLYSFVAPRMNDLLLPNNVHFRPSANLELAQRVAKAIHKVLN